ncbi:MAG: ornithine carbamoyltransferase, partial [Nitratireductor sp.]|nr:ornithine carbamoyltransferase [Nitratireductor sp.]
MTEKPRHFLDISQYDSDTLEAILKGAERIKGDLKSGNGTKPLEGKMLAMIFDKPSTRTRVSFDVGMRQLGGETLFL